MTSATCGTRSFAWQGPPQIIAFGLFLSYCSRMFAMLTSFYMKIPNPPQHHSLPRQPMTSIFYFFYPLTLYVKTAPIACALRYMFMTRSLMRQFALTLLRSKPSSCRLHLLAILKSPRLTLTATNFLLSWHLLRIQHLPVQHKVLLGPLSCRLRVA